MEKSDQSRQGSIRKQQVCSAGRAKLTLFEQHDTVTHDTVISVSAKGQRYKSF